MGFILGYFPRLLDDFFQNDCAIILPFHRVERVEGPVVVLAWLEWRMVVREVVPGPVKVVRHHVEEVQRL
jgi:hypothetical protein